MLAEALPHAKVTEIAGAVYVTHNPCHPVNEAVEIFRPNSGARRALSARAADDLSLGHHWVS